MEISCSVKDDDVDTLSASTKRPRELPFKHVDGATLETEWSTKGEETQMSKKGKSDVNRATSSKKVNYSISTKPSKRKIVEISGEEY